VIDGIGTIIEDGYIISTRTNEFKKIEPYSEPEMNPDKKS
jgi:hypothetical protein